MKIEKQRSGFYFDTYNIYNEDDKLIGMYEDHYRGVKEPYFVGWTNLKPFCGTYSGDTKHFKTKEEVINYAIKGDN